MECRKGGKAIPTAWPTAFTPSKIQQILKFMGWYLSAHEYEGCK
jgi:hypothetical protein